MYSRPLSATAGLKTPSGQCQTCFPVRASRAYVPRSPCFAYREATLPQAGHAAKYTRPSITLGAPCTADDAENRQRRSPVAALNAMK